MVVLINPLIPETTPPPTPLAEPPADPEMSVGVGV